MWENEINSLSPKRQAKMCEYQVFEPLVLTRLVIESHSTAPLNPRSDEPICCHGPLE